MNKFMTRINSVNGAEWVFVVAGVVLWLSLVGLFAIEVANTNIPKFTAIIAAALAFVVILFLRIDTAKDFFLAAVIGCVWFGVLKLLFGS